MPFFIKGKRKSNGLKLESKTSESTFKKNKHNKIKPESDEEISSDFEDDVEINHEYKHSSDEEEIETVQEKRLRLANKYLEEIANEEKKRLEANEIDKDIIAARLKDDVLEQAGKLRRSVAKSVTGFSEPCILRCKEHGRSLTCLVVSSDNQYLFTASDDFNIVKWSLTEKKKLHVLKRTDQKGHMKKILALAISSDNKFLVSGGAEANIHVWSPEEMTHIHTFAGHKIEVSGLVFRRDTHQLFSCSSDKTLKIWNLDEMMYVETMYGHQVGVMSIDALSKDRAVTAGGRDNTLRIWKVVEESHLVLNGHKEALDCVRLLDEDHMVSGGEDGYVCLWSSLKKKPLCTLPDAHGKDSWVISIAACPFTDIFATGSHSGAIEVYKVDDSQKSFSRLLSIQVVGNVNALAFTSDGTSLIAAIGQEHRLGRWTTIKAARNSVQIFKLNTGPT